MLWAVLLVLAVLALAAAGPLTPTNLRCTLLPVYAPDLPSQTSYRIQVSLHSSITSGDQWDSGQVASSFPAQVEYGGRALVADTTYYWRVMWWDASGTASPWSDVAYFDTGLFNASDWGQSIWISGYNMFRTEFSASSVARARAYIAGIGYHELYINGNRVGSNVLDPAWTYYPSDSKYVVHDITKDLRSGNNTIGVLLGNGWWGQNFGYKPQLRLLISLTTTSGSLSYVWSDTTWLGAQSPITSDSIYNGETYNATMEQKDWNKNKFDASSWSPASQAAYDPPLIAQLLPPIRTANVLMPRNMTQPSPGTYVFDFGQNFSGWCVLSVKGSKGTTVTLRHAEILYPNGTLNVENLRSALATDTYILSGDSKGESYEPRFTYHGFRFVSITGYPGSPSLKSIYAKHVYSSVNTTGGISFFNPTLDRIQSNIWWGQTSNLMSVPTDCDQRDERLGWMADAHLSAEEALHNFDMSAFYSKWVRDMAEVQASSGAMYDVVPPMRYAALSADPAWEVAYPLVASYLYSYYNDSRIIAALYPQLENFVSYLASQAQKTGLNGMYGDFGDWVPPPPQPKASTHFTGSFYYLVSIRIVGALAAALGEEEDAETYAKLFSAVTAQFNAAFLSKSNSYDQGLQTDTLLPLWLGIAPSSAIPTLETSLINDIVNKQGTHLTTGILGTKYLPIVLDQIGRTDLAIALALQLTYPSWGYMFTQSDEVEATTLWELWNSPTGSPSMDSRNHIMFGSIGAWFYETLAGIRQSDSSVGYASLDITPPSASSLSAVPLTHVNASLNTIRGDVYVAWQLTGNQQCAKAHRDSMLQLSCGPNGGVIKRVQFASYGAHAGDCVAPMYTNCHAQTSMEVVEHLCVGKTSCEVQAADDLFGVTACGGAAKSLFVVAECSAAPGTAGLLDHFPHLPVVYSLNATIPVGSVADITVSKAGFSNVTITEGHTLVWNGGFVHGDAGVINATEGVDSVVFTVGSGTYNFTVTGSASTHIRSDSDLSLQCPGGARIAQVRFASLGNAQFTSLGPLYGACHIGSSKHVVERACLGREACQLTVAAEAFGEQLCDVKHLAVEAVCAW